MAHLSSANITIPVEYFDFKCIHAIYHEWKFILQECNKSLSSCAIITFADLIEIITILGS